MSKTSSSHSLSNSLERQFLSESLNDYAHEDLGVINSAENEENKIELTNNIEIIPNIHRDVFSEEDYEVAIENFSPCILDLDPDEPYYRGSIDSYPRDDYYYSPRDSMYLIDKEDICLICYEKKNLKSLGYCFHFYF